MPAVIPPIMNAPMNVPQTLPRPPNTEVPPTKTAARVGSR